MSAQRQPYLVMDYLEGTSLKDVIKAGEMTLERADHIYEQVCEALATAHNMDLVHRDLKPENIMLSNYNNDEDWVTLVDFGLSKLKEIKPAEDPYQITKVGDVCGSPPYMSPEQCLSSQVVDPRSDIYSLGVCIYETLAGKLPFTAKSAIEMLDCHLYATPIPFNQSLPEFKVCSELTAVLNRSLQKEPEKRYQTVEEFGTELKEAIRRDSVKLKAYRHRMQTSEFSDLASEAQALSRQLFDSGKMTPVNAEVLDGVQFVNDAARSQSQEHHRAPVKPTDRRLLDTEGGILEKMQKSISHMVDKEPKKYNWSHCPYCDAPAEAGVRFCLNCQQKFISPEEAAKLQYANQADMDHGARGFSARAKKATAAGGFSMAMMQWVIGVLLLVSAAVMVAVGYRSGALNHYMSGNGFIGAGPSVVGGSNGFGKNGGADGTDGDGSDTANKDSKDSKNNADKEVASRSGSTRELSSHSRGHGSESKSRTLSQDSRTGHGTR